MKDLKILLSEVYEARQRLLDSVRSASQESLRRKPDAQEWSVTEVIEHLVLAEHAGIRRIWSAADELRTNGGRPQSPSFNAGLSIEQIVARTWRPKEIAPPNATPSGEGCFEYWVACFKGCDAVLEALGQRLTGVDLEAVVFPHFLCGPLDARQRLEFLRFHIDRHREQMARLLAHP